MVQITTKSSAVPKANREVKHIQIFCFFLNSHLFYQTVKPVGKIQFQGDLYEVLVSPLSVTKNQRAIEDKFS